MSGYHNPREDPDPGDKKSPDYPKHKIPKPGDKNTDPDFRNFALAIFSRFSNPGSDPRKLGIFFDFSIQPKIKNSDPKKSQI